MKTKTPRSLNTAIAPSRRQLMLGSAAAVAIAPASLDQDPAIEACKAWQAAQTEYEDLNIRWQALETHLFCNHNWPKLSRRQRAAIPEAAELDQIDDRRDEVSGHEQQLLTIVLQTSATTPHGLVAKLSVAASIVRTCEHAEGHALIASALRDFRRMTGDALE